MNTPRLDIGLALSTMALIRGGLETSAAMLTRGLASRGHRITLVAGSLPGRKLPPDLAELPARWLLVPHLPCRSTLWHSLGVSQGAAAQLRSRSFIAACSISPQVRRLMARASATMTFLPRETAFFSAWRGRERLAHLSYFPGGGKRWLSRDRSAIRLVNPAVAVRESDALAEFPPHGILGSGVPRHWLGKPYEVRSPAKNLLFVGRLEPNKGVVELLAIFEKLLCDLPEIELRIVGDGPLRASMHRTARRMGIGGRVSFAGAIPQDRIQAEMRRADLLLFPTHFENFPLTLLEASTIGLPAVSSDIPGIRGMLHEGATLLDPRNGDWVGETRALLTDPARRRFASDCGRRWAVNYDWESVVDQAEQYIYRAVEICAQAV